MVGQGGAAERQRELDIVVCGHLCLDLLPEMASVPLASLSTPGRLFEVGEMRFSTGGAVSNTGLALHRLGAKVRLMSAVGDDLIGRAIRQFLEARDPVLTQFISTRTDEPSSYTIVLSPQLVDRIFLHCTGTNRVFSSADVNFDLVATARLFHLGYPPILPRLYANDGRELERILALVKARDVVTSVDLSLPDPAGEAGRADWRMILRRALPHIDIFVPSIEEILFMLRPDDYQAWHGRVLEHLSADYLSALADELLAMGPAIVGFKLGEMGVYLRAAADRARFARITPLVPLPVEAWVGLSAYHPAFEVLVAGTTGAGDSAYAGLLVAMLKGLGIHEAARWSAAVGACNVEAADATSGIRTWEDTAKRLESGWAVRNITLAGWRS